MMFKVALINMPFAVLAVPALGLTQLKGMLKKEFRDQVEIEVLYLNHDFAHFMGLDLYRMVATSHEAQVTGLGDWLFRRLAFPELPDNTNEYFRRYFPQLDRETEMRKQMLLDKWEGTDEFMSELVGKYALDQTHVIGLTSMFSQNLACFAMARKVKERNPKAIAVMGGANCEWPMGQEIAYSVEQIDYVFSGPALKSFPQFIRHCMDGQMEKARQTKGVLSKSNGALPALTPIIGEELPIDVSVELDYDSYLETMEKNFPNGDVKPTLLFETSRGCWWGEKSHCTFCGLNGLTMNYREMRPEKATDLLKSLFQYSHKVEWFEAVDNIMPKSYPKEVFSTLDPPSNVSIFYEVKADLTEEEIAVLSKAHVRMLQPGIESLATSTLKLMKKGTSAFRNVAFLKNCVQYGIEPRWNLLVGFPGEGEEVYKKYVSDIPWLTHLHPPSGAYPVRFDRYSPYFVQKEEYGLDLHPLDYYSLIYPFDEGSLSKLAYYFEDHNVQAPYRVMMSAWIDQMRKRIDDWIARWDPKSALPRPQLYFKENSTVVYDSRPRRVIEHQVGPTGKRVLECLEHARRLPDLAKALSDIPDFDPQREVAFLQYRGLIFQEGDKYISLALPKEPSTRT